MSEVNKEVEEEKAKVAQTTQAEVPVKEEEFSIGTEVTTINPMIPSESFVDGVYLESIPKIEEIGKNTKYEAIGFRFYRINPANNMRETHIQYAFMPTEPSEWGNYTGKTKTGKTPKETAKEMAMNNYEYALKLIQAFYNPAKREAQKFNSFRAGIEAELSKLDSECLKVPAKLLLSYNSQTGILEIPNIGNVISSHFVPAQLIWDAKYHNITKPVREKAKGTMGGGSNSLPPINEALVSEI